MADENDETVSDDRGESQYGATDPGMSIDLLQRGDDDGGDVLDQLRAENGVASKGEKPQKASNVENTDPDEANEPETNSSAAVKGANVDAAEIDDELIDRALDAGFTAEELRQMQSSAALRQAVSLAERLAAREKERKSAGGDSKSSPAKDTEISEPNWQQMLDDGHDPQIVKVQQTVWQQANAARSMAQQIAAAEADRAFQAQCQRFDSELSAMTDLTSVLGTGTLSELTASNPAQAANRQRVFTQMEVLRRGYEVTGRQVPSESQLIRAAAASAFPDQIQKNARQQVKQSIRNANSQALPRSGSGSKRPLTGPDAARQKEAEFWKTRSVE